MKMNAWSWVLVAVGVVVVAMVAIQAPDIARYMRIKRM
jgi:hypothetical protein